MVEKARTIAESDAAFGTGKRTGVRDGRRGGMGCSAVHLCLTDPPSGCLHVVWRRSAPCPCVWGMARAMVGSVGASVVSVLQLHKAVRRGMAVCLSGRLCIFGSRASLLRRGDLHKNVHQAGIGMRSCISNLSSPTLRVVTATSPAKRGRLVLFM